MINNNKIIAIIPARGGSKRLPRKNVLPLAGKPLIVWTIEAAQKAKYIDRIIVSTDDQEIARVSRNTGIEIMLRPKNLASDTASSVDVIFHVINNVNEKYDNIMLLQPTSPLRNEKHIDLSCEIMAQKKADAVISLSEMDHSPLWANKIPENGDISKFLDHKIIGQRSQDLPKYYYVNGAIYICNIKMLTKYKTLFLDHNIYSYIMDKKSSIDIDCEYDFMVAECIINNINNNKNNND